MKELSELLKLKAENFKLKSQNFALRSQTIQQSLRQEQIALVNEQEKLTVELSGALDIKPSDFDWNTLSQKKATDDTTKQRNS